MFFVSGAYAQNVSYAFGFLAVVASNYFSFCWTVGIAHLLVFKACYHVFILPIPVLADFFSIVLTKSSGNYNDIGINLFLLLPRNLHFKVSNRTLNAFDFIVCENFDVGVGDSAFHQEFNHVFSFLESWKQFAEFKRGSTNLRRFFDKVNLKSVFRQIKASLKPRYSRSDHNR